MPAPTQDKTWQYSLDNLQVASGNPTTDHKQAMISLKNMMLNGNGQWTVNSLVVVGSSNGTTFGLDGVDRWGTVADINNGAWIILRDVNATAKFEILIRYITIGGQEGQMSIHVSRLAGFGAANGGTDGNATTAPSATDVDIASSSFSVATSSSKTWRFYGWRSTDGQFTRILMRNATDSTWTRHWYWGRPKAPAGGIPDLWSPPVYWCGWVNTTLTSSPEAVNNIRAFKGSTLASAIGLSTMAPFGNIDGNTVASNWRSVTQFAAHEMHLHSTVGGVADSDLGIMFDTYGVSSALGQGEMAPLVGSKTWAVYGDSAGVEKFLLPHNNTTLKFSVAP